MAKNLRNRLLTRINICLGSLIALLTGLTGCESFGGECMYGTPSVDLQVKVGVRNLADQPLKDIQLTINPDPEWMMGNIFYTDTEGRFTTQYSKIFPPEQVIIEANDTTGTYKPKTDTVSVKFLGDSQDAWYRGTAIAESNIYLIKYPDEPSNPQQ